MSDRSRWLIETIEAQPSTLSINVVDSEVQLRPPVSLASAVLDGDVGFGSVELGTMLGRAVAELHSLPTRDCPFDASTTAAISALRCRLGSVAEPLALPEPYCRYPADRLVDLAESQLDDRLRDPVVIHANLRPGTFHISPAAAGTDSDTSSGTDSDMDSGTGSATVLLSALEHLGQGDRHRDLAAIHRHLPDLAGAEALFAFYDAYGHRPDLIVLDAWILLSLLAEQLDASRATR